MLRIGYRFGLLCLRNGCIVCRLRLIFAGALLGASQPFAVGHRHIVGALSLGLVHFFVLNCSRVLRGALFLIHLRVCIANLAVGILGSLRNVRVRLLLRFGGVLSYRGPGL